MIRTADQQHTVRAAGGYRRWVEKLVNDRWATAVDWEMAGAPLKAWINYSNWAVNCDCCRESVVAEPGEPFYCPNCENAANGYKARPVDWPDENDRAEIEHMLLLRPNPDTRMWMAGETIDDLKRQNAECGLGV